MEKYIKRKARKDYECICGNPIKKGEEHWFYKVFYPKGTELEYKHVWFSGHLCLECHLTPEQVEEKQRTCPHEHIETSYSYIPGEAVMEPDYEYCVDCGKIV